MKPTNIWWAARGLFALHAAFAVIGWFNLPPHIPTHFGAAGRPDDWSARSLASWFALLGVSLATQCLLPFITSRSALDLWNIPEKERFLRLTPEQQQPAVQLMRAFSGIIAACMTLTMFALHVGVYLVAQQITTRLPWYVMLAMFTPVGIILVGMIPWARAMRRAILQASPSQ